VLLAKHLNRWIRHQEFNGRQVAIRSSLSNLSEQRIQYGGNSQTMPGKSKTPAPCSTSEVRISDTSGREEVPKVVDPTYLTKVNRNIPEMVELAIPNFQWIQYDTVQVQYIPYPRLIWSLAKSLADGKPDTRRSWIARRSVPRAIQRVADWSKTDLCRSWIYRFYRYSKSQSLALPTVVSTNQSINTPSPRSSNSQ